MAQFVPFVCCHSKQIAVKCFLFHINFSLNRSIPLKQTLYSSTFQYISSLPCGETLIVLIQNESMYPQKNQSHELTVFQVIIGTFKFFKTISACFFSIVFYGFKGKLAAVGCRFVTDNVKLIGLSEPGKMVVQDFKIFLGSKVAIGGNASFFGKDYLLSDLLAHASTS